MADENRTATRRTPENREIDTAHRGRLDPVLREQQRAVRTDLDRQASDQANPTRDIPEAFEREETRTAAAASETGAADRSTKGSDGSGSAPAPPPTARWDPMRPLPTRDRAL